MLPSADTQLYHPHLRPGGSHQTQGTAERLRGRAVPRHPASPADAELPLREGLARRGLGVSGFGLGLGFCWGFWVFFFLNPGS